MLVYPRDWNSLAARRGRFTSGPPVIPSFLCSAVRSGWPGRRVPQDAIYSRMRALIEWCPVSPFFI